MRFKTNTYINKSAGGIRVQGNTALCIRYHFIDGKRLDEVIGVIDRWADELPEEIKSLMTEKEIDDWKRWKDRQEGRFREAQLKSASEAVVKIMMGAAQAHLEGIHPFNAERAAQTWSAINKLAILLESSGFPMPEKFGPVTEDINPYPAIPLSVMVGGGLEREYKTLADRYERLRKEAVKLRKELKTNT
ncbi:hypothetical protein GCM10009425_46850 [Pseudomonas asuensis]|uniref:Uncharacterized protein n=1 Tax=Pseudomonas asuensis TaxID=1825787 RepID=A0ABQ2H4M1_9PSED|nr:hypothetical protein [Pseudomonas asuensis]GGM30835.1 hypothetical protein GCM10009425_46850 [Pseudomonas asuensis]